jgi:hypothetical protein
MRKILQPQPGSIQWILVGSLTLPMVRTNTEYLLRSRSSLFSGPPCLHGSFPEHFCEQSTLICPS